MADHYQTLGLKPGASDAEAKAAFRQLAKECHPDLHPNDAKAEARFKEINQAYEAIVKGDSAQEIPFRSGNFNFHVDDLFGHAFGDILGRPRRNMDTHLECRLTLEDMFIGKDLTIQIPFGRTTKAINVTMPAGIQPGMRVSVPRSGGQMNPGLPPGDLYVVAQQLPHARFHREGNNLLMTLPAAAFERHAWQRVGGDRHRRQDLQCRRTGRLRHVTTSAHERPGNARSLYQCAG